MRHFFYLDLRQPHFLCYCLVGPTSTKIPRNEGLSNRQANNQTFLTMRIWPSLQSSIFSLQSSLVNSFVFPHAFAPTNKLTSKKKKKKKKRTFRKRKSKKSRNETCWKMLYLNTIPCNIYLQKCHLIFPYITNQCRVWIVGTICKDKCMRYAINL